MKNVLYVANLPAGVTEAQLRELFSPHGDVVSVELGKDESSQEPYGLVQMAAEKAATQANHALNGYQLADRRLAVSYPEVDTTRPLTTKLQKAAGDITTDLGETEKIPVREIKALVLLCGTSFAEALLAETVEIEAAGGLMTADGTRRRTKGGVFFLLARRRLSPQVRHLIFDQHGKMPQTMEAE
jgi:hypothetical protein